MTNAEMANPHYLPHVIPSMTRGKTRLRLVELRPHMGETWAQSEAAGLRRADQRLNVGPSARRARRMQQKIARGKGTMATAWARKALKSTGHRKYEDRPERTYTQAELIAKAKKRVNRIQEAGVAMFGPVQARRFNLAKRAWRQLVALEESFAYSPRRWRKFVSRQKRGVA